MNIQYQYITHITTVNTPKINTKLFIQQENLPHNHHKTQNTHPQIRYITKTYFKNVNGRNPKKNHNSIAGQTKLIPYQLNTLKT